MKSNELSQKTKTELVAQLKEKKEHLMKLRFDLSAGKLKNFKSIKETKKDIARLLTFLKGKS